MHFLRGHHPPARASEDPGNKVKITRKGAFFFHRDSHPRRGCAGWWCCCLFCHGCLVCRPLSPVRRGPVADFFLARHHAPAEGRVSVVRSPRHLVRPPAEMSLVNNDLNRSLASPPLERGPEQA